MSFQPKKCLIKTVYCGDSPFKEKIDYGENTYQYKRGTSYECLKKGVGVGMYISMKNKYDIDDIAQIKYVGEKYRQRFRDNGVKTQKELINLLKPMPAKDKKEWLDSIFLKNNNVIDKRPYNTVLVLLYKNGVKRLPQCI